METGASLMSMRKALKDSQSYDYEKENQEPVVGTSHWSNKTTN
jgi:hypothetical protein